MTAVSTPEDNAFSADFDYLRVFTSGAVGGFAELPAVAGAGTSGMGGTTYAVLAGAAAEVLALAVLATLSVKKRGNRLG